MVLHFMAGVMSTTKALERKCPKCQRKQVVAPSRRKETVRCKHCGEAIPPAEERRQP